VLICTYIYVPTCSYICIYMCVFECVCLYTDMAYIRIGAKRVGYGAGGGQQNGGRGEAQAGARKALQTYTPTSC